MKLYVNGALKVCFQIEFAKGHVMLANTRLIQYTLIFFGRFYVPYHNPIFDPARFPDPFRTFGSKIPIKYVEFLFSILIDQI